MRFYTKINAPWAFCCCWQQQRQFDRRRTCCMVYAKRGPLVTCEGHTGVLGADGLVYTWGRNEHWQLGYEVVGLLNSGQSFDAQQVPMVVPIDVAGNTDSKAATEYHATHFACGCFEFWRGGTRSRIFLQGFCRMLTNSFRRQ